LPVNVRLCDIGFERNEDEISGNRISDDCADGVYQPEKCRDIGTRNGNKPESAGYDLPGRQHVMGGGRCGSHATMTNCMICRHNSDA
jgi:hypothetical protein